MAFRSSLTAPLTKCSGPAHACSACEPARLKLNCRRTCADPESFVKGDPTLTTFVFKVDRGREDPSPTLSGPSSARQRNAFETPLKAFRWHADECPTLNAGLETVIFQEIRTCIARKPYIFVIFQCGGPDQHM